jgi:PAS domain S-box-containing protein
LEIVSWIALIVIVTIIEILFLYYYTQDGDHRKLMFVVGYFCSSLSFIYKLFLAMGYSGIESDIFMQNLFYWSSVPLMLAIIIASTESIWPEKNFFHVFRIFLVFSLVCGVIIFLPFSIIFVAIIIYVLTPIIVIPAALYLYSKRREVLSQMFLLGLIYFSIAGLSLLTEFRYLTIFSNIIGFAFIGLVFIIAFRSEKKFDEDVSSYFVIQKKLEDAQKSLYESKERFRLIVENINDVIILTNPTGTISYTSPSSQKVFGYKPSELAGHRLFNYNKDFTDGNTKYAYLMSNPAGGSIEYPFKAKNGDIKWVSHSWSPIFIHGTLNAFINVLKDITEGKNAQETIKKHAEELDHVNKELNEAKSQLTELLVQKNDFINQLAHDLKNPLVPITNLLPVLLESCHDPDSKQQLEVVQRNVYYIKDLVIDTLKLAKLNNPAIQLEVKQVHLLRIIENIIDDTRHLEEKGIRILNKIDTQVYVLADELQLKEVFTNLLSNAMKFIKENGDIIIDSLIERDKHAIIISITDNGRGMTREQLNKIFTEFYKADESRHIMGSSGLGLPICKRIIEKHRGRIWAESPGLGQGSTFYFTLPLVPERTTYEEKPVVVSIKNPDVY